MSTLKLTNINKSYGDNLVLKDFNLEVKDGQLVSLLGPSGCGKSTILKTIAGIVQEDSGSVFIDGEDITNLAPEKRDTVIVFQDHLLFPHMTVRDNIGFGLKMRNIPKGTINNTVEELLSMIKLDDKANAYPSELSGGQKQRVALARALAVKPKVLLLDEPFSNLDPALRSDMRILTKELQKQTNTTTLLVTHDKDEAMVMSDKIAVMLKNKVAQYDEPQIVYTKPKTKEIADFFGITNYIDGRVDSGNFISELVTMPVDCVDYTIATLMLRPENIYPDPSGYEFMVANVEYRGDRTLYKLISGKLTVHMLTNPYTNYSIGDKLKVSFNLEHAIIF